MKFVLFNESKLGLLTGNEVVDLTQIIPRELRSDGQNAMVFIINNMANLSESLNRLGNDSLRISLSDVSLQSPLPHPGKILCMGGNFSEFGHRRQAAMWGFIKSSESVIGPEDSVILPPDDANIFHHEAELVVVFGRHGENVDEKSALDYVFGYTCGIDVSARMPTPQNTASPAFQEWRGLATHKSYPTFAPIGPAIITKDEIPSPQDLNVRLKVNGELRGDFNTSDMAHSIAKSISFASRFESFSPGDILYTGTNHQGLGAMQHGDEVNIEIDNVGAFSVYVKDNLGRRWERGVDEETAEDMRNGTGSPGRRKRPI